MNKLIPTIALLALPTLAEAVTEETWSCRDRLALTNGRDELVRVIREGQSGAVAVAGTDYRADFRMQGFNRRWDFGSGASYAFIIKPNGDGMYYDFSMESTTSPSQLFKCRRVRQ